MINKLLKKYKKKKMLSDAIKNLNEVKYNMAMIMVKQNLQIDFREKYNIIHGIKDRISFYKDSLEDNYYDEIFSYEEAFVIRYDSKVALTTSTKIYKSSTNWFAYGSWEYLYNMITIGRNQEDCLEKYNKIKEENKKDPILITIKILIIILSIILISIILIFFSLLILH